MQDELEPAGEGVTVTYGEYFARRWGRGGLSPAQPLLRVGRLPRLTLLSAIQTSQQRREKRAAEGRKKRPPPPVVMQGEPRPAWEVDGLEVHCRPVRFPHAQPANTCLAQRTQKGMLG